MKRLLIALLLFSTPASAQWMPYPYYYAPPPPPICFVTGQWGVWLNLRVWPNGPLIAAMAPGTPLTLLGVDGRWGYVQPPVGQPGWSFLPYTTCGGGY